MYLYKVFHILTLFNIEIIKHPQGQRSFISDTENGVIRVVIIIIFKDKAQNPHF